MRLERYGPDDGRVADARLALTDLERLAKLSDADRAALVQAEANHQAAAKIYLEESVYNRAIVLVQAAWESRQKILGPEHRKTLASENLLSNCLFSSNRFTECEPHYKHVLEARLALLGPEHIDVATSHNNLARNFYWQQHYTEAVDGHRKALAIRRKMLGDQASDTLSTIADLADALSELATEEERAEHLDAARPLLEEVLTLRIDPVWLERLSGNRRAAGPGRFRPALEIDPRATGRAGQGGPGACRRRQLV